MAYKHPGSSHMWPCVIAPAAGDFGQDTREADARQRRRFGGCYEWRPSSDPTFFPGRQAAVHVKGEVCPMRFLDWDPV